MLVLLLLTGLIGNTSLWALSPEPPGPEEVERVLSEEPMSLLLFTARTGWVPEGIRPDSLALELIAADPSCARTAAWAARTAGYPLETQLTPALLEFGDSTVIPAPEDVIRSPELMDAALRRMLHAYAEGGEPDSVPGMVGLVSVMWGSMSLESRALALEVLGKAGVDISGELSLDELLQSGLRASARYFSEIGMAHSFPMGGECLPLDEVYMASCAAVDDAAMMLDHPLWAVRYRAVGVCSVSSLTPLLEDEIPYVVLRAAEIMNDSGYGDEGIQALGRLALLPGPVGHQAASRLGTADSILLLELMNHPEPGRRAAAQSAWLDDSMEVTPEIASAWLAEPYWVVPVSWAWHLTETGDSLAAHAAISVLLAAPGAYSDPEEVLFYADMLGITLRGEEDVQPSETAVEWPLFDLPFDPGEFSFDSAFVITDEGEITIELWNRTAPVTSATFAYLAGNGFYDGIAFHRVIPGFMAQAGCPEGTGNGGPGFEIPAEPSIRSFTRGVVGMADAGLNTGGSQFFIMLDSHGRLDGRYTAFGRVVDPAELDRVTVGTVIRGVRLR